MNPAQQDAKQHDASRLSSENQARKKLNICMLAYAFYETDTRIMQYATALVEQGEHVDVIALQRNTALPKCEVIDGVCVYRLQRRSINEKNILSYIVRIISFFFRSLIFLWKESANRSYNIVHVHNVPDFLVFAALIPKIRKAAVLLDIHDLLPELYASKFRIDYSSPLFRVLLFIERQAARFADHIIVANHIWRDRLAARSSQAKKCSVIRNHPDLNIFVQRDSTQVQKEKFTVIYPGSLNWHQGLDISIRAFALISDEMSDAEFHIYGEGPAKQSLQRLVLDLGLTEQVIFHNFLASDDIAKIMSVADLAIEPKRSRSLFGNEALSTKILEFLLLGIPVIACRTKIHAYYYDDSLVQYYENDNEIELAEQIRFLRNNPIRRSILIENGKRYALKNTWGVKKQEYLNIITSLSNKRPVIQSSLSSQKSSFPDYKENNFHASLPITSYNPVNRYRKHPSYVLISAAHNEELFIEETIRSVVCQTIMPICWVIVSDGSTDATDEIVKMYSEQYSFIQYLRLDQNIDSGTESKVNALSFANAALKNVEYDYIGNIDADITFKPDYFEVLLHKFDVDQLLGIAGGTIYEYSGKSFEPRISNTTSSVAHAVQLTRRKCYEDINGYVGLKYGGEDWYAEVNAKMLGWIVQSFEDLEVRHHRPPGTAGSLRSHRFREGKMDYSIGSDPLFELMKCVRRAPESPIILGAALRYCGFLSCYINAEDRLASSKVIRFLRSEQRRRIKQLFGHG